MSVGSNLRPTIHTKQCCIEGKKIGRKEINLVSDIYSVLVCKEHKDDYPGEVLPL